MERQIRTALEENPPPTIEAVVKPIFDGDSERPSKFTAEWTKDGEQQDIVIIVNN